MEKLRIIVGGFIGILPAGGVTWDYLQYPLGFALLGHDVYYIEDTRLYPVYQKPGSDWNDSSSCIEHLQTVMNYFGLSDRWAYRDEASGKTFGMSEKKLKEICRTADVFVNISCSTVMREEYADIPVRMLIDTDPMFTQIQYETQQTFTPGDAKLKQLIDAHNCHFSFGENIHQDGCKIPSCGISWKPTRQPVCLSYWKTTSALPASASFTTLMNWTAGRTLFYNGQEWGQKDAEFQKFISLPLLLPQVRFSVVMNCTGNVDSRFQKELVSQHEWNVLDPEASAGNWETYRHFIRQSFAEFSVAKHTYVQAFTGWFSCRSACYLASGKPVVTQDTGWSSIIPSGKGLFAFDDIGSAKEALLEVTRDYKEHCLAAKQIATEYFDSNKVLSNLLSASSVNSSNLKMQIHQ